MAKRKKAEQQRLKRARGGLLPIPVVDVPDRPTVTRPEDGLGGEILLDLKTGSIIIEIGRRTL